MTSDKAAVEPVAWIVLWDADDEGMPGDVLLHRESGANNRAEEARAEGYTNVRVLPLYSGLYIEQLHTDHAAALQAAQGEVAMLKGYLHRESALHDQTKIRAEAAERRVAALVAAATQASATLSHIYHTVPLPREVEREAYADYQRLDEFLETFK